MLLYNVVVQLSMLTIQYNPNRKTGGIPSSPMGYRLFSFRPIVETVKMRSNRPLDFFRFFQVTAESLYGSGVRGSGLLDGLLQKHILHLSRSPLLASPNAYQNAPGLTTPDPPISHPVPGRTIPAHPRSGKSTVQGPVALTLRHRALLLML